MLFWIWLRPRYKIPEFFTIAPVLTSTLTVCRRNHAIRRLYIGFKFRVRYKYYKKTYVLVWPGAADAPIAV